MNNRSRINLADPSIKWRRETEDEYCAEIRGSEVCVSYSYYHDPSSPFWRGIDVFSITIDGHTFDEGELAKQLFELIKGQTGDDRFYIDFKEFEDERED